MQIALADSTVSPSPDPSRARRARRARTRARQRAAKVERPELRLDRLGSFLEILRLYRSHRGPPACSSPLRAYLRIVEAEVAELEASLPPHPARDGATVRTALSFLRSFGRLSALDFDQVPIEERPTLVALLALEYRWCFAAAGTTQEAFKVAIGRTGAR